MLTTWEQRARRLLQWAAVAGVGMGVAVLSCLSFLPGQWLLRSPTLAAMFRFDWREAAIFLALLLPLVPARFKRGWLLVVPVLGTHRPDAPQDGEFPEKPHKTVKGLKKILDGLRRRTIATGDVVALGRLEEARTGQAPTGTTIVPRLRAECDIDLITILDRAAKA